jgi:hypothetical protein
MKSLGMGNKTKSERRLLLSENILPMQESGQFLSKDQGDYLEQSELGFGIFLLMVILISR